jgi:hypothetical protein
LQQQDGIVPKPMQAIPNIEKTATITVKNKPKSNMLQIIHIMHYPIS